MALGRIPTHTRPGGAASELFIGVLWGHGGLRWVLYLLGVMHPPLLGPYGASVSSGSAGIKCFEYGMMQLAAPIGEFDSRSFGFGGNRRKLLGYTLVGIVPCYGKS